MNHGHRGGADGIGVLGHRGGSIGVVGQRGGSIAVMSHEGGLGHDVGVVMPDNGSAVGFLDDGLTLDGVRLGDGVGPGHMDGSGDLDDPLDGFDHVIGHVVGLFNGVGLVDCVDLLLDGDDGSIDGLGALQGGGHGDPEVRNSGLEDLSDVSRDVGGLSQMNLLSDDGGGVVDGGYSGGLLRGLVGGGKADGSRSHSMSICLRVANKTRVTDERSGGVVGRGGTSGGKQGRKNQLQNI